MDTQSELASSDGIKVENSAGLTDQMIVDSESDVKSSKEDVQVKAAVSSTTSPISSSTPDSIRTSANTLPTTVIATRPQRMITTQGHITEIAVAQAPEEYEQYQITASGDDQNVYTYEASGGIIITAPSEHLPPGGIIKRDMMIEKDHNGSGPSVNVVNAEPQTVYVELKNEDTRIYPNAIRYEPTDRYHRFHGYHGVHGQHPPPPPPPHYAHHQRELAMKTEAQQAQEIQIYEAEQQNAAQNEQNQNIQEHSSNEPKTHYTNLEPVGSSQNSYFISTSENYQPSSGGQFTYLTSQPAKETSYVYHATTGSPVLYKGTVR